MSAPYRNIECLLPSWYLERERAVQINFEIFLKQISKTFQISC